MNKNKIVILILMIILVSTPILANEDYTKEGMTLNFKDVEINNVFRQLAETTNLNIVTTENVEGNVDIFLNSVSLFEAIDILTTRQNLDYIIEHNTVIIGTKSEIEEIKKSRKERITKIYYLENVKPSLIEENISHLVKSEDTIQTNEDKNNILVTSTKENLIEIQTVIHNLDLARRQVAVKVQFEEISHTQSEKAGINWSNLPFNFESGEGLLNVEKFSINQEFIFQQLQEEGATRTLANPRLSTIEGQEASINIGDRIPYITSRSYTEDGREEVDVEYEDLGINLSLTPRITSNNNILIELEPEVTNFVRWIEVGDDRYPEISVKELKTQVEVKDGHTLAIGGLIQYTDRERKIKVPLLNKIPKIGNFLFTHSSKTEDKRELIIFITPQIITNTDYHFDGRSITKNRNHIYTVQEDDYFIKLGELFNIPFIRIMEENKQVSVRELYIGMNIKIPIPEDRFYKVQADDSYESIAKRKGLSVNDLKRMNNEIKLKEGLEIVTNKSLTN